MSTRFRIFVGFSSLLAAVSQPGAASAQTPANSQSVLVLPFENVSGASDDEWIREDITRAVLHDLQSEGTFSVTVGDASASGATDASGRIVTGSYQRLGDQIRIMARLLDADSGEVTQVTKLDGHLDQLPALQDRIVAGLGLGHSVTAPAVPAVSAPAAAPATTSSVPAPAGTPTTAVGSGRPAPRPAPGPRADRTPALETATQIDALVRRTAEALAAGTAAAPAAAALQQTGTAYDLSLDEAVAMALEGNLDIRVERLNPQTFDFSLAGLEANYAPTFTSNFSNGTRVTLSNSQLTTRSASTTTDNFNWGTGLNQRLRWGGASYSLGFDNRRADSSNEFTTRNPSYTSSVTFAFVQPLLRNFKVDTTRTQLQVTRINQELSEVQLTQTITNTLANVRNAYWDYVYATQAVVVARESLSLAEKLVEDNQARVEIGAMAPIDVIQAQAEAANRRQTLTQAESTARTTELALKRLIASGTDDPAWQASLVPTDRPSFQAQSIDIEEAVSQALQNRTDVVRARRQLQSNDLNLRQLNNQLLPALDLNVNYGLSGLGGPQFVRSGLGGTVAETIPGGYAQALTNISGLDAPNWTVSLNLSYPVGNGAAEANVARARLQQRQTEAQLRSLELQVATEVTNAALQVQSNLQRVETAGVARELSQQRLEAEESKFEVGLSTNYFVVQAQRDLRDSQIAELRALLDYQKSLVDYERSQETSLGGAGITLINGGGGGAPTATSGGGGGGGGGF